MSRSGCSRNVAFSNLITWGLCFAVILPVTAGSPQGSTDSNQVSVIELQNSLADSGKAIRSFRTEGVLCAIVRERNLVVLQDHSGAALFELPLNRDLRIGDWVAIEGQDCSLTRTRYGIRLGTAPVVENDGTHSIAEKSGTVFLNDGLNAIQLEWFNGIGNFGLRLEYEGPGVPRQAVPNELLCSKAAGDGLNYGAYEGSGWLSLPDLSRLTPVAKGVATNFSVSYRTRDENCALSFSGFIAIKQAGVYNFYLASDDGSRLHVGNPNDRCKVVSLEHRSPATPASFDSSVGTASPSRWSSLEGEVAFVGQSDIGLEMEVASGTRAVLATIVGDCSGLAENRILHHQIQLRGVCNSLNSPEQKTIARFIVPSPEQIQIQESTNEASPFVRSATNPALTTAKEVQRLEPEQARKKLAVRIKGIVTQASPASVVLQDATGGVFIHYSTLDWTEQPRIGELWQMEGTTDPGDFSPVVFATKGRYLGASALPEPIRPTWDQLINGSLDAQFVEIRGVVVSVSETGMEILTAGGKIDAAVIELRRFYADGCELFVDVQRRIEPDELSRSYVGSLVRIRGCVAAVRNRDTRQVEPGSIRLVAATVALEQSAPSDPFVLPTRKAADLLLFDPRASMLQRAKVSGQVLYARPPEYLLQDGQTGFRALTKTRPSLQIGDYVEAVGFPQLGAPSLMLVAAQLRKTGTGPLPIALRVLQQELQNRNLDSTRIEIEATLLSETEHQQDCLLELQSGPHHFQARLDSRAREGESFLPGSRLRLRGVYSITENSREEGIVDPFELLLNGPADVTILQQPSWWTARHTITVIALLTLGLGMAMIWINLLRRKVEERTVQLKKEIEERQLEEHRRVIEQERSRVAQDLHDELGAGLTEVGLLGDLVNNSEVPPPEKSQYLTELTEIARALVTSLDEIVWAVNPSYDSVASVASYYTLFAQRFLNLAGVACRPHIPVSFPECPMDSKGRHGLFLAFKEALNNVVRHSKATEVSLRIEVGNRELIISVADNGKGFHSAGGTEVMDGEGLQGMRRRMENLGGSCKITSQPRGGTEVELRLPLLSTGKI